MKSIFSGIAGQSNLGKMFTKGFWDQFETINENLERVIELLEAIELNTRQKNENVASKFQNLLQAAFIRLSL